MATVITLHLDSDLADQLAEEAKSRGLDLQRCAAQLIEEQLPSGKRGQSLKELFIAWAAEDANSSQSIAQGDEELRDLKLALNANRGSERKLFAE